MFPFSKKGDGLYLSCERCGLRFYITPIEIHFYSSHGGKLEPVCRSCKRWEQQSAAIRLRANDA